MEEVWKTVQGYGGHYEASSFGRIRSKDRVVQKKQHNGPWADFHLKARVLSQYAPRKKYGRLVVRLSVDGKKFTVAVHRLVLLAFVGPPPDGYECCHNNGVNNDNRPENLRWGSHENNTQDRRDQCGWKTGEAHPMAKYTPAQILGVRSGSVSQLEAKHIWGMSQSHYSRIVNNQTWKHLLLEENV